MGNQRHVDVEQSERAGKIAWEGSAELRAEFGGDMAVYLAFLRADARGAVKILGGRAVPGGDHV